MRATSQQWLNSLPVPCNCWHGSTDVRPVTCKRVEQTDEQDLLMSLITHGVTQAYIKDMKINLDKHISSCIMSSFSLHKTLTQCKGPPPLPWYFNSKLKLVFDRCGCIWLWLPFGTFCIWLNFTKFICCYWQHKLQDEKRGNVLLSVYSFDLLLF